MQEKRHGRSPFGEEILRDEREYAPEKSECQGNRRTSPSGAGVCLSLAREQTSLGLGENFFLRRANNAPLPSQQGITPDNTYLCDTLCLVESCASAMPERFAF